MRRLWILMTIGLLAGLMGATLSAQTPHLAAPVFSQTDARLPRDTSLPAEQFGTLRTRLAALDTVALNHGLRGGGVMLNLFDDVSLVARMTPSDAPVKHTRAPLERWAGDVEGVLYGQAVFISDGSTIDLRVLLPGYVYYVQTVGAGVVRISEIEAGRGRYNSAGQPIDDAVIYTPSDEEVIEEQRRLWNLGTRADSGAVIDVLAAYTPAAAAMLGGDLNAQLAIEGAAALTNLTYQNSGVNFRIRLVAVVRTEYTEQGFGDLTRLQGTTDGFMDELHTLRNTLKADLVTLTPGTPVANRNYCGIANLPLTLNAASGFSITEAHCINDITYAHELGHNMGKAHDRSNSSSAIHSYAFGYQDASTGTGDYGDFVTVMAYSTNTVGQHCPTSYQPGVCPAIAWWSDPAATFGGKPLGRVGGGGADLENNARSLNETALTIANYRVSDDGGAVTPTPFHTATLIPLPTAIPVTTSLALNGGFEIDADSDGTPDGWVGNKTAKRFCDTASNPTRGLTGLCSLRLTDGGRARQTLNPTMLVAGDVLSLSFEAAAKNIPNTNAKIVVTVTYVSPTAGANNDGRDVFTVAFPAGNSSMAQGVHATLTLDDAASGVLIQVQYPKGKGNLRIDSLSLVSNLAP